MRARIKSLPNKAILVNFTLTKEHLSSFHACFFCVWSVLDHLIFCSINRWMRSVGRQSQLFYASKEKEREREGERERERENKNNRSETFYFVTPSTDCGFFGRWSKVKSLQCECNLHFTRPNNINAGRQERYLDLRTTDITKPK